MTSRRSRSDRISLMLNLAVEQLPLSLERHFALLKELDEHVHEYHFSLLPMLQRYTEWRRLRAGIISSSENQREVAEQLESAEAMDVDPPTSTTAEPVNPVPIPSLTNGALRSPSKAPSRMASLTPAAAEGIAQLPPSSKLSEQLPQNSTQAQVLLSRVARLSEEMVSASQEKINVAKSAYDTVDRHIRLLDQAIQEQELALSHGLRPGTQPAPIVLPDLAVPKGRTRAQLNSASSDPENIVVDVLDHADTGAEAQDAPAMGIVSEVQGGRVAPTSGKRRGRRPRMKQQDEKQEDVAPSERAATNVKSVKLRMAPVVTDPVQGALETMANPDEPRYCFCNQVSYGEMIACDNEDCEREWFHYGCVDLTVPPRGRWFCRECKEAMSRPKRGRKKRR
ncbi:hypothetical protein OE88DRAFT_1658747 [Heliocybe sulcata]|uniref:Chromatin modification-related protein n=1 Tax=Heliocybe sulcata TaxID=5364 RepID=A0A5C3N3R2_9AGAM|nr:hypothetical protein OE88DRAFT_1658747 [Heliocybe sulcata]